MKMPNKFINYKDSALSKFPEILELLEPCDLSVMELYKKLKNVKIEDFGDTKFKEITLSEYVEILDCLYLLGKIELVEGAIHYVKKD